MVTADQPVPVSLAACHAAWQKARRGKKPSANQTGRGSHAAVDRLQTFMRQRANMPGTERASGWYLQLDVHNFFNSIHRPTLYALLCRRLGASVQRGGLPSGYGLALRSLCHKLLARRVQEHVRDPVAAARVPLHKRLSNAAPSWRSGSASMPAQGRCARLQALLGSCWGHFAHANSVQQRHGLFARMPWLRGYFELQADGSLAVATPARWQVMRRRAVRRQLHPL